MQPYQLAAEEQKRQGEMPITALKKAGSLTAGIGSAAIAGKLGGIAFDKVAPFLSKYIPQDLAIKGLNKIDPRFGKFISKAMSAGKTFEEANGFISGKMDEETKNEVEGEAKAPKEELNIIQKYSPELHEFLVSEIKKGKPAKTAAILSRMERKGMKDFKKIIRKIEQDHKAEFEDLVEKIYETSAPMQNQTALPTQQTQQIGQPQQAPQQTMQPKQQLLQAMQALSQQLRQ